jgi:uncharacterized protein YecE (DUF72 family)
VAGRVRIGTSGYVYPHWRGTFYPRGLSPARWLDCYARHFDTVELNNPFYRLPTRASFAAWRRAAPAGFVFAVKASRYLTHMKRLKAVGAPLRRFLGRASALEGALGPVLLQLPPQFHANRDRLERLVGLLERQRVVAGLRVALEVRHPSWLTGDIFARLERAGICLCFHDARALPVHAPLTADFVYLRRHGAAGHGGSYDGRALAADARAVRAWRRQGRDVYVYFNNDARGFAVRNALRLRGLLR